MKLIFTNNAEKEKTVDIVMNASSISNSKALMDLVKDSIVDGSEPEPAAEEKKAAAYPERETMAELTARAVALGISTSSEDSRAGLLAAIKEAETVPEKIDEALQDESLNDNSLQADNDADLDADLDEDTADPLV